MTDYEFTLKFRLAEPQVDPDRYADELYGNGCDDAVIGVGRKGKIALQFTREAESANTAILSAIADVRILSVFPRSRSCWVAHARMCGF